MNKDFLKKLVAVFTAASLFVLLFQPFHIGDTIITQEASKNYNGYLPVFVEDYLIEEGFAYDEEYCTYNMMILNIGVKEILINGPIVFSIANVADLEGLIFETNQLYIKKEFMKTTFEFGYNDLRLGTIYYNDAYSYTSSSIYITIYGISNYE